MNKITFASSWRLLALPLVGGMMVQSAHAVPSFARQTGMACEACHTIFPELTPFGRQFKINGYTITGMQQIEAKSTDSSPGLKLNAIPPLSFMFQTSVSRIANTDKSTGAPIAQQYTVQFPQQASIFFAGEITQHIGSFLQMTYSHQTDHFTQDQSEIRYANQTMVMSMPVAYGLTVNNTPTMEDPWQGTFDWHFPDMNPGAALPVPNAAPLMSRLGQSVAGIGAYTHINNHWYLDVTGYRSEQAGKGQPYNATVTNYLDGISPYWRAAFDTDLPGSAGYLEVGAYGMMAKAYPTGISNLPTGGADHYIDNAVDMQYELPLGNDMLIVRGQYVMEKDKLNASYAAGNASNLFDSMNYAELNVGYHFGSKQEAVLGYQRTTGTPDAKAYQNSILGGSAGVAYGNPNATSNASLNNNPASTAFILEYDYLPAENVKLGVQYTAYTQFDGGSTNYDGQNRNASQNNTAMLSGWFMW